MSDFKDIVAALDNIVKNVVDGYEKEVDAEDNVEKPEVEILSIEPVLPGDDIDSDLPVITLDPTDVAASLEPKMVDHDPSSNLPSTDMRDMLDGLNEVIRKHMDESVDTDLVREIVLYIENDEQLYNRMVMPIITNLSFWLVSVGIASFIVSVCRSGNAPICFALWVQERWKLAFLIGTRKRSLALCSMVKL